MKTTKILTAALLLSYAVAQAEIEQLGFLITASNVKEADTVMSVIRGYLMQENWRILLETYNTCMNESGVQDDNNAQKTPEQKTSLIKLRKNCEAKGIQQATLMLKMHNAEKRERGTLPNGETLFIKGSWTVDSAQNVLRFRSSEILP